MPSNMVAPLVVSDQDREQLERIARSTSLPHRAVRQAKALIWAAEGLPNAEVARRSGVDPDAVRAWRSRFEEKGIAGVGVIAKGRGRRSWLPDGTVAEVLRVTQQELPPDGATQWSTRSLAGHMGVGKDTVARIWRDHELKPWKVDRFKISNDPRFEEKLVDVVGLYMNPPDKAVVLCMDEKVRHEALSDSGGVRDPDAGPPQRSGGS
jgi:transposase